MASVSFKSLDNALEAAQKAAEGMSSVKDKAEAFKLSLQDQIKKADVEHMQSAGLGALNKVSLDDNNKDLPDSQALVASINQSNGVEK